MKKRARALFAAAAKAFGGRGLSKLPGMACVKKAAMGLLGSGGDVLVESEGLRFYLSAGDEGVVSAMLFGGVYERCETSVVKEILKPGMVVVDVGANFGYFTLLAAKLVGGGGRVYAFEPVPQNYKLLEKNIRENGCSNVVAVSKAVSDRRAKTKIFLDKTRLSTPSLSEGNVPDPGGFASVETIGLDDFFAEAVKDFRVDFIKVDAQGAEALIFAGAGRLIAENRLKVLMELWPYGLENMGSDPKDFLDKLIGCGFRIKLLVEGDCVLKEAKPGEVIDLCRGLKGGRGFVSLLLEK